MRNKTTEEKNECQRTPSNNRLFFNWPLICYLFLGGQCISYFSCRCSCHFCFLFGCISQFVCIANAHELCRFLFATRFLLACKNWSHDFSFKTICSMWNSTTVEKWCGLTFIASDSLVLLFALHLTISHCDASCGIDPTSDSQSGELEYFHLLFLDINNSHIKLTSQGS